MQPRLKCILDCDPGHDDLAAIFLACMNEKIDLQFLVSVHGNETVNKTYVNCRRGLALCGLANKIPVYKGYAKPLVREAVACPEIHGENGLGGIDWKIVDDYLDRPEQTNPAFKRLGIQNVDELKPYDFMKHLHELIMEVPDNERFTIIATAAATNIAQYLMCYPSDANKIRVVSMAGNFNVVGNIGPFAEFNVLIDPEAYQAILDSDVELIFAAPLDITHTVLATEEVIADIDKKTAGTNFGSMFHTLLCFFKKTYNDVFNLPDPPLHDPVAVFYCIHPELFESRKLHCDIECQGKYTYGACCTDLLLFKTKKQEPNTKVCLKLTDIAKFWEVMGDACNAVSKVCPF